MALELLLQCQPVLKMMSERSQAVWVCPVLREFKQAHDDIKTTPEIHIETEQIADKTCLSSVTETSDYAEGSLDETVRSMKYGGCDPVTDEGTLHYSKTDIMDPPKVEVTFKEHTGNSNCDHKEGCGKEAQQSSGSDVPQDRNETEEELAEQEEESSLVQLLEQRLQFVLRSLTKLCLSRTEATKKDKE
jgi:hypothetical protein